MQIRVPLGMWLITMGHLHSLWPSNLSEFSSSLLGAKSAGVRSQPSAWSVTTPSLGSSIEPPALPWTSHLVVSASPTSIQSLVETAASCLARRREPILPIEQEPSVSALAHLHSCFSINGESGKSPATNHQRFESFASSPGTHVDR
jgi:hypothetical protein